MARNRKREDVALRWGTLVRSLLASLAIAGLGVGYVRQSIVQDRLGREWNKLEQQNEELTRAISAQRHQLSQLKSGEGLRVLMARHGISLTNPSPARRIYLELPVRPVEGMSAPAMARGRSITPARVLPARTTSALATLNTPTPP